MYQYFNQYDSPLYKQLVKRRVREKNLDERMEHIKMREYAYLTRIGGDNFITFTPFRNRTTTVKNNKNVCQSLLFGFCVFTTINERILQ